MIYAYPCNLTPDEDGALVVTFPDVPEAITGGKNRSQALEMAEDSLATALAAYVHEKREIPVPSALVEGQELVAVATVVAAKLALYSAMRAQRITKVELAGRLGISESAVRKLANPDHRSHITQVQKALRAVGHSLVIEVIAA
ncbi:MAG: type II toxin-antitoxin system HicB family antitoxin [Deltaproteobacteria bacterium]|nr:type II toxin-antitoxin system HicB family antitoxin [Deltaproteobacteria bacterium]